MLRRVRELVVASAREGWPDEQPAECADVLGRMIAFVEDPQENGCPPYAAIQFLPAGPVQEIAMANDWHDAYLALAERYDAAESAGGFFG